MPPKSTPEIPPPAPPSPSDLPALTTLPPRSRDGIVTLRAAPDPDSPTLVLPVLPALLLASSILRTFSALLAALLLTASGDDPMAEDAPPPPNLPP